MKKVFDESILDGKYFEVHQDWETPIPGLFILASKRNIRSVGEFIEEEAKEFVSILVKVRKAMKEVLGIKYVYLFQREDNLEYDFHIWIFPKYAWMTEKFGQRIQTREVEKYAQENMTNEKTIAEVKLAAKKVREYLNS
jgi:diadenosine tetraphosphate (Ap4A) HIT family hydrolase